MRFGALIVLVAMLGLVVGPAQAGSITLQDLLDGNSISVGDKTFFGFGIYSSGGTGGGLAVAASSITVTTLQETDEGVLEDCIIFNSTAFTVTAGQTQDTSFEFFVRVNPDSRQLITDAEMEIGGFKVTGTGNITLDEDVLTVPGEHPVTTLQVGGTSDLSTFVVEDDATFAGQSVLEVHKDLGLSGGDDGTAQFSDFDQCFSQSSEVPEPLTMGMVVFGVASLFGYVRRRRIA